MTSSLPPGYEVFPPPVWLGAADFATDPETQARALGTKVITPSNLATFFPSAGVAAMLSGWHNNDSLYIGVDGVARDIVLSSDHATVPWKFHSYSATFGGVRDDVLNIGFNVFNQDDMTRAGMGLQIESDYFSGGVHASEFILAWNAPVTGAGLRPLQINVMYNATMQHLIRGSVYYYNDNPVGSSYLTIIDGVITPALATHILGANNDCYLRQKNSVGVSKNLIYLDASGVTQIASDGGGAKITGNSQLDGTLRVLRAGGFNALELSGTTLATYQFGFYIGAGPPDYLYLYAPPYFPMAWSSTGLVSIGHYAPSAPLHVLGNTTTVNVPLEISRIQAQVSTAGTGGSAGFGSSRTWWGETASDTVYQLMGAHDLIWSDSVNASRIAFHRFSNSHIGVSAGYGGFVSANDVAGTAIPIIPNMAGDVTDRITVFYQVYENGGGFATGHDTCANGATINLYTDGVDTLTLAVVADGSVTLQRTAGAATFDVSMWMLWR